ncbi:DNA polymerase III subunit beta [Sphingobacterium multivorum]|uniref:DNA polymerase III subunit beta n=1 Tax=Sphingobacterium multivorum TaxID=28454 RepID=UPI0028A91786|nr:DNA polymerase III subunit beta [Sphingobacterium multivorum]
MKFKAKTNELKKVLQQVTSIVVPFATTPIISNILFTLTGNNLELVSSDYANMMVTSVEVEGEEDGQVVFDGKLLLNILKSTVEPEVLISQNDDNIQLVLTTGVYDFPLFNPKDYPKLPVMDIADPIELKSTILIEAIKKTSHTISDDSSTAIGYLLIRIEGMVIKFVSTIGHIVSEFVTSIASDKYVDLLVSKKSISALKPLLIGDTIKLVYNDNKILFQTETTSFYCVLGTGAFVNYVPLIPQDFNDYMVIDRSLFLGTLNRLLVMANAQSRHIKLHVQADEMEIACRDNDYKRSASEKIAIINNGPCLTIGFDAKYLIDILSVYDSDSVKFKLVSNVRPGILRPDDNDDYTVIIAPLNLP